MRRFKPGRRSNGHGQQQLPLAGDVQHAAVILDHVADGLQVALEEAGHDLALEAAILALFDDPLADDEFHQDLFAHQAVSSARLARLARRLGCACYFPTFAAGDEVVVLQVRRREQSTSLMTQLLVWREFG
jgi:hypothetical protein